MKHDPRIDAKIAAAAPFAQPILQHLRALVHRAIPEAEEAIKWGMPHFTYRGKNIAGMAAFKAHCGFILHKDDSPAGGEGGGMGQFGRITTLADLPPDEEIVARLLEAKARVDGQGGTPRRSPGPKAPRSIEQPEDVTAALAGNPQAQAFWATLPPSQHYEYLDWITGAKRGETRARRVAQAIDWLAEGKRRNWKYEAR